MTALKILGRGELTKKLTCTCNAFTASAIRKIEECWWNGSEEV